VGRDGDECTFDLPFGKSEIFFISGLDRNSVNQKLFARRANNFDPSGEFGFRRTAAAAR
jgi:hypothetical protein